MKLKFKLNLLTSSSCSPFNSNFWHKSRGGRTRHDNIFNTKDKMFLNFGFSIWCRILNVPSSFHEQAFVWQTTFSAYMNFDNILNLNLEALHWWWKGERTFESKTSKSECEWPTGLWTQEAFSCVKAELMLPGVGVGPHWASGIHVQSKETAWELQKEAVSRSLRDRREHSDHCGQPPTYDRTRPNIPHGQSASLWKKTLTGAVCCFPRQGIPWTHIFQNKLKIQTPEFHSKWVLRVSQALCFYINYRQWP